MVRKEWQGPGKVDVWVEMHVRRRRDVGKWKQSSWTPTHCVDYYCRAAGEAYVH